MSNTSILYVLSFNRISCKHHGRLSNAVQPHSSMFPQLYSPTALCSNSSVLPQLFVPTVYTTVPYPTAKQFHCSMFPLLKSPTALCPCNSQFQQLSIPTAAQCHSSKSQQHFVPTAVQRQSHSSTCWQPCNPTAPCSYSCIAPQLVTSPHTVGLGKVRVRSLCESRVV